MSFKNISISPLLKIAIISIFIIAVILFYLDYHKYDNHIILNKELQIKTKIEKMKVDHGYAILNDSIVVPSGTALKNVNKGINKKSYLFIQIDNPFILIKNSGSLEFSVIKNYDTLLFKIPE